MSFVERGPTRYEAGNRRRTGPEGEIGRCEGSEPGRRRRLAGGIQRANAARRGLEDEGNPIAADADRLRQHDRQNRRCGDNRVGRGAALCEGIPARKGCERVA
jgi:hypothetical protein